MPLPPLAFGQATASLESNVDNASAIIADIVPSMKLAPAAKTPTFLTKMATSQIGDMRLLAHTATPCRMQVEESKGWHLIGPYIGIASLKCDGNTFDLHSGKSALLLPNMMRSTERAPSSVVIASIKVERLEGVLAIMSGNTSDIRNLDSLPLKLNLERNPGSFPTFLQICAMINATLGKDELSASLGIDDLLYRWIAVLLQSEGSSSQRGSSPSRGASVDIVCDLVRSSFSRPLTLTEMEEASGLSARSLQYAFRSRFGCSPMEWQRAERMLNAQERVMNLKPDETITQVAYAMGFSSSAAFSALYRRHFGETPSQTLHRVRG